MRLTSMFVRYLPVLIAGGCGTSDQTSLPVATHDSAGVQIVVNGGHTDSALVLTEPQLRIGTVMGGEPAYEFHEIGPIAVNAAGDIFVGNGGSLSIRVFDAEGRHLREFGRSGQGPGEFRSLTGLLLAGDTVLVFDRRALRASLFRSDGTFVDSWDLRLPENRRAEPVAVTTSGVLALVRGPSRHFSAEPLVMFNDTVELAVFDPVSRAVGPRLRHWAAERRIAATEVYPIGPLFEPRSVLAVRADGAQYQAFHGRYAIDVFDAAGKHVRQSRRDVPAVAITSQHVDELQAALGNQPSGSEQRSAVERSARYPVAAHFSTLGAILVAGDGSFLVQRLDDLDPIQLERGSGFGASERSLTASAVAAVRWERFDVDGRYIGAIRLPPRYIPRFFDGRNVFGVLSDEDGVQSIARFSVAG